MAWVFGGKKFGQYTYEHWFDDDVQKLETPAERQTAPDETDSENSKTPEANDPGSITPRIP